MLRIAADRLAGIEQQIGDGPFDLLSVHDDGSLRRFAILRYQRHPFCVGMDPDQGGRPFEQCCHQLWLTVLSGTGSAEDEQRLDHVCCAVHGGPNVRKYLCALLCGEPIRSEKLGIGKNRRKIMAEIVRNGTRHAADCRETLGFEQRSDSLSGFRCRMLAKAVLNCRTSCVP